MTLTFCTLCYAGRTPAFLDAVFLLDSYNAQK